MMAGLVIMAKREFLNRCKKTNGQIVCPTKVKTRSKSIIKFDAMCLFRMHKNRLVIYSCILNRHIAPNSIIDLDLGLTFEGTTI